MYSVHHEFRRRRQASDHADDDRNYWLRRATDELRMARVATDARAKLAHYELSGRYSIKALFATFEPPSPPAMRESERLTPAAW